jgi:hypothetical protein
MANSTDMSMSPAKVFNSLQGMMSIESLTKDYSLVQWSPSCS